MTKRAAKISVLQVGPMPPQIGGMETFFGDLVRSLQPHVHVIVLNIAKLKLQKGGKYAIKTGYVGAFKRNILITLHSYLYSLRHFIKYLMLLSFRHIHVVHIHTASFTSFWEKAALVAVAKLFRKAVVLHVHGALFKEFYHSSRSSLKRLIRRTLQACDALIVLSDSWRDFFTSIVNSQRIYVVENGIDVSPFEHMRLERETIRLFHIGEVSARKGIYDLLNALKDLKEQNTPFYVDIVGPGELEAASALIAENHLQDFVTLHGPKRGQAKYAFFERASVFVLASYAEGLPIAIIEALAAGLVVISTTVGGIPDLIKPKQNGFLVAPGDTKALSESIQAVIENAEWRQHVSDNNRKLAFEKYNIKICAQKVAHIYKAIL